MGFQQVDLNDQQLINSAKGDCESIRHFCDLLLAALGNFFALQQAQVQYGVNFKREGDLLCSLEAPYGKARGQLTNQLVDGVMTGRYVFEKSVVSSDGKNAWTPVWAIRIGRNGNVWLGDEGDREIDAESLDAPSLAVGAVARSLLYRIAVTPIFK